MKKLFLMILLSSFLLGKDTLLFYCGITMVKPMTKISNIIEKKYNINIQIIQGGSSNLYKSIVISKKGDLYLPGSDSFIQKHLKENIFGYRKYVGYNQISLFVKKGNPRGVKNLNDLLRNDLKVALCDPKLASAGKVAYKVLKKFGGDKFIKEVEDNILLYAIDSRDFNQLLKSSDIDIGLNWKATAFFPENRHFIDIIEVPQKYAVRKKLVLTELKFTKHPKIVKAFIDFASSKDGQKIMKRYGFLDE